MAWTSAGIWGTLQGKSGECSGARQGLGTCGLPWCTASLPCQGVSSQAVVTVLRNGRAMSMKVTVWGARGSVPTPGAEYDRYGGDTTCLSLETEDGTMVILDAGTGLRRLGVGLVRQTPRRLAFLLSHAHWDHVIGFPFFKPLYRKGFQLDFYGCMHAQESVRGMLEQTMQAPFFPVDLSRVGATLTFHEQCGDRCHIDGLTVRRFPLSHPNGGCGFRIEHDGRSVVFFPDNEMTFDHKGGRSFAGYADFCRGCDLLIHDAEYRAEEYAAFSRGWGHSVFTDTVRLGLEAGAARLLLWHINQDRDDVKADALQEDARAAVRAAGSSMACDMAATGMVIEI